MICFRSVDVHWNDAVVNDVHNVICFRSVDVHWNDVVNDIYNVICFRSVDVHSHDPQTGDKQAGG